MPTATTPKTGDPRLRPFLEATTEHSAILALERLLGPETEHVVRDAVRRALGDAGAGSGHTEDVASEVRVRLVRKLWSLRRGIGEPIDNFLGYAVNTTENACYTFLRRRYPERTRFRNRLRYAAAHHPGTTLTRDEHGIWHCLSRRAGRIAAFAPGGVAAFLENPQTWLAARDLDTNQPLPALVDGLLASLGDAIELDRLVDALAPVLGIVDASPATPRDEADGILEQVPDPAPGIGDVLQQRETLERVWNEIVELPVRQRAALLLNLRDPDGGSVLQMLPATGVVSEVQIAAALQMDAIQLTALWDRLPLDDLSIADRLSVTRQQVINLRKAARARLTRRLRVEML
jgi:DNA-directed RNA polymerase specialized sigma24 family protein